MNCCDRLAVIAKGNVVGCEDVYRALEGEYDMEEAPPDGREENAEKPEKEDAWQNGGSIKTQMEQFEAKMLLEALRRAEGNQAKAARMLGMSRSTFWRRLNAVSNEKEYKSE